jgi:hypothetical protein
LAASENAREKRFEPRARFFPNQKKGRVAPAFEISSEAAFA